VTAAATVRTGTRPNATELRRARLVEKQAAEAVPTTGVSSSFLLALDQISPSPNNPRKFFDQVELDELAENIRAVGILQPVIVRVEGPAYQLVAGERRWRAAKLAGLAEIPAVLLEANGATAARVASVSENYQRSNLSPLELADAIEELLELGLSQEQAAARLGMKGGQSRVAHLRRLRVLPAETRAVIAEGQLSVAHAEALAKWAEDFPAFTTELAKVAVENRWSARAIAEPDFDALGDQDRFEGLLEQINQDVILRAGCRVACPWNAFREGDDSDWWAWCLRPPHAAEIEALLDQERAQTAQEKKATQELSAREAVAAVRAARDAVIPSPPVLEVGDRVRHGTFGEGSVLEAKPHAVLIKIDDGGKQFWTGINAHGGGKLEVLDGEKHATSHTDAPPIPDYWGLPHGTAVLLKHQPVVPPACAAAECTCWGQSLYAGAPEPTCTAPSKLLTLQTRWKKLRAAEDRRRHDEAVQVLETFLAGVLSNGVRELAVIAHALAGERSYHPAGTSFRDAWKLAAPNWIPIDLDQIAAQASSDWALLKLLVEAICRQDLAMRFHPEGGATYGELASWYVGQALPERTPNDWQPAKELVKA